MRCHSRLRDAKWYCTSRRCEVQRDATRWDATLCHGILHHSMRYVLAQRTARHVRFRDFEDIAIAWNGADAEQTQQHQTELYGSPTGVCKKYSSGKQLTLKDKPLECQIRGWRVVSAFWLQGSGSPKRSVFFTDTGMRSGVQSSDRDGGSLASALQPRSIRSRRRSEAVECRTRCRTRPRFESAGVPAEPANLSDRQLRGRGYLTWNTSSKAALVMRAFVRACLRPRGCPGPGRRRLRGAPGHLRHDAAAVQPRHDSGAAGGGASRTLALLGRGGWERRWRDRTGKDRTYLWLGITARMQWRMIIWRARGLSWD